MCQFLCLGLFDVLAAGLLRLPPWCRLSGGIQEGAALTHGDEAGGVRGHLARVILRGLSGQGGHLEHEVIKHRSVSQGKEALPAGGGGVQGLAPSCCCEPCCLLLFSVYAPSHRSKLETIWENHQPASAWYSLVTLTVQG